MIEDSYIPPPIDPDAVFFATGEQAVRIRELITMHVPIGDPSKWAKLRTESGGWPGPMLRPPFSRPFTGDNAHLPVYPGIVTERFRDWKDKP